MRGNLLCYLVFGTSSVQDLELLLACVSASSLSFSLRELVLAAVAIERAFSWVRGIARSLLGSCL